MTEVERLQDASENVTASESNVESSVAALAADVAAKVGGEVNGGGGSGEFVAGALAKMKGRVGRPFTIEELVDDVGEKREQLVQELSAAVEGEERVHCRQVALTDEDRERGQVQLCWVKPLTRADLPPERQPEPDPEPEEKPSQPSPPQTPAPAVSTPASATSTPASVSGSAKRRPRSLGARRRRGFVTPHASASKSGTGFKTPSASSAPSSASSSSASRPVKRTPGLRRRRLKMISPNPPTSAASLNATPIATASPSQAPSPSVRSKSDPTPFTVGFMKASQVQTSDVKSNVRSAGRGRKPARARSSFEIALATEEAPTSTEREMQLLLAESKRIREKAKVLHSQRKRKTPSPKGSSTAAAAAAASGTSSPSSSSSSASASSKRPPAKRVKLCSNPEVQRLRAQIESAKQEAIKLQAATKMDADEAHTRELRRLTEKWTLAAQEVIQEMVSRTRQRGSDTKSQNATIGNLLGYFGIEHEMVRYNAEMDDFE